MALRSRRQTEQLYWPGFVDAMATLLLVIVFLLSIFVLSQVFLSRQISGKDNILSQLRSQISELTESLALERNKSDDMESQLELLSATLSVAEQKNTALTLQLDEASQQNNNAGFLGRIANLEKSLEAEEEISDQARAEVQLLNQQIAALRQQLTAIQRALDTSEAKQGESEAKIADLGRRLNAALVAQVEELQSYKSDFFGLLKELLQGRDDIRVEGDRFVFQSELLFPVGSDNISSTGGEELRKLAQAILEIASRIPEDVNWVIRVDGHTDSTPINTEKFPSNWELSAARAIAVARALTQFGVPPDRLLPAGFGEYRPIAQGNSPQDLARNRRIEFKLTER